MQLYLILLLVQTEIPSLVGNIFCDTWFNPIWDIVKLFLTRLETLNQIKSLLGTQHLWKLSFATPYWFVHQITILSPLLLWNQINKTRQIVQVHHKCKRTHLARIANAEFSSYFGVHLLSVIIAIQGKSSSQFNNKIYVGCHLIFINIGSALETVPVSGWYQKQPPIWTTLPF